MSDTENVETEDVAVPAPSAVQPGLPPHRTAQAEAQSLGEPPEQHLGRLGRARFESSPGGSPRHSTAPPSGPWPLFCHGPGWVRVKGYGIRYVDHRRHPKLFSERYGYERGLHIGSHCLMVVKP